MITNITSPLRGEKYTLVEVIRKGIERRGLTLDSWEFTKYHECFYGSIDGNLEVENFGVPTSLWNKSVIFSYTGGIPVHFTADGKMSIGFGCGVDRNYYGQFPGQSEPENPEWERYKNTSLWGSINIETSTEKQNIDLNLAMQDEEAMSIFAKILQRKIAEGAILGFWEKDP